RGWRSSRACRVERQGLKPACLVLRYAGLKCRSSTVLLTSCPELKPCPPRWFPREPSPETSWSQAAPGLDGRGRPCPHVPRAPGLNGWEQPSQRVLRLQQSHWRKGKQQAELPRLIWLAVPSRYPASAVAG